MNIAKLLYSTDNFQEKDANDINKLLDYINEKFIKSDTYNILVVENQQKYNEIHQELETINELVSYGRIDEIYNYEVYLDKIGRKNIQNNKTRYSFNYKPIELAYYFFNLIFEQELNYQTVINKVDESRSLYQSGEVEKNELIGLILNLFNSKDKLEYFITNFFNDYKKEEIFISILIKNKKLGLENIYFDDIYKNNFILLRNDINLLINQKIPYLINVSYEYQIINYLSNYNQNDLNDYIQKNLNETTLFEIYIVLNLVHFDNIPYFKNQFNIEYFINFIKTNKIAPYKNNIFNNFEQYFNKIDFSFDENKKIFLKFFELMINKNFKNLVLVVIIIKCIQLIY